MLPLWQAVVQLQAAGYSRLSFFPPKARHPSRLLVLDIMREIPIINDKVPVRYLTAVPILQRMLPSTLQ
jgi:hypothetical protein